MFHISPDQTQWFHLYRVQKASPIMFVLFACEEINDRGNSSRLLDLRIVSGNRETSGGSWCVQHSLDHAKPVNRADCTKFLELRARFMIATTLAKGIDEIEMVESSRDELALAASLDEALRSNLVTTARTLFPKLARDMINRLDANQTGVSFAELNDWATRDHETASYPPGASEPAPYGASPEPLTTKTQRVPV